MKILDECHKYEEIAPDTYRIEELGFVNCYLIVGSQKALLIDSGCGAGMLSVCVKELTSLPVIAAVTHRHPDHVGAGWQFGSYYADAADCTVQYDLMCAPKISEKMVTSNGAKITYKPPVFSRAKVIRMAPNQSFDLGGRIITVRRVPGHTKGSVIFLEEDKKLMFTGDDVNPYLWMQLPGCTSLEEWLNGACRIREYLNQGYTAYYGHGDGRQDLKQVEALISAGQEVIQMAKSGRLEKGKHIYPSKDQVPNLYYNSKNIL
jgi:hydroxyacylglutathione hydrolase